MSFDFSAPSKSRVLSVHRGQSPESEAPARDCSIADTGHTGHEGTKACVPQDGYLTRCNVMDDSATGHAGHSGHAINATDWQERYEAQAATLEYDGELPRHEAESQARREIFYAFAAAHYPQVLAAFDTIINHHIRH